MIRPYMEADQSALIALWQACGLLAPHNDPVKDIARKLLVDRDLFLVCERQGEVVGSVMGGYEGHRAWINYLAVHPKLQRSGIGSEFMREIEQRLRAKGAPKINLQVRSANTEVVAFYQALGYSVDDVVGLGKRLEKD